MAVITPCRYAKDGIVCGAPAYDSEFCHEHRIGGPAYSEAIWEAQEMSRCDLTVASVGIGTYGDPKQPFANEVKVSDELKRLLIRELELGVNCPDDYPQDVHLVLTFVRHSWESDPA